MSSANEIASRVRLSRLVVTALFTGAFLIQSQPALAQGNLALSANQGAPEKNIRANGCSWQPAPTGGAVHIFWPQNETALPQPADQVASAGPGSGGSPACFQTADFEVPQRPPGTYKVVACQDPECNFPSPNFSAPFEFTIPKPPPPPPPEPPPPPPPPPSGSPTSSPTPTLTPSATPTSTVSPTATVTATPSPGGEEGEGLPDLELDKPSTEPGGEIVANGRNCEPVSNVAISVADKPAGSTDADTEGRYRARLKLPDGVGVGRHSVVAACAGKTFETTVDVVVLAQTASPAAAAGAAAVAIATLGVFAFYILQAGDLFKGEGSGPRRR